MACAGAVYQGAWPWLLQASYHRPSMAGGSDDNRGPQPHRCRYRRRPSGCPGTRTSRAPPVPEHRPSQSERGRVTLGRRPAHRAPRRLPRSALALPSHGYGGPVAQSLLEEPDGDVIVDTLRSKALPEGRRRSGPCGAAVTAPPQRGSHVWPTKIHGRISLLNWWGPRPSVMPKPPKMPSHGPGRRCGAWASLKSLNSGGCWKMGPFRSIK
jgi:hypothetical protein